jgi:ATP-binding cassette subfamily B protein
VRNQKALTRLHIGQSGIIACGVGAVMVTAGQAVVHGTMTVGDLVLINSFVIQVCLPLNSLGFIFREANDALINAEKLFALLDQKPEVPPGADLPALAVSSGEVRFEQVSFAYEPARPILSEVDFRIAPGSTIAVVGGSGSGKSTLARLLFRFYDVGNGRVTVDGQDIRDVSPQSLRQAIGIVPQDTTLFNDSIVENIAYGRSGATREEVIEAAKAANVHDFIVSLPERYDTVVGERGLKLSGGEKQRIAIARAMLKNPPILVFDEATSALDTRAERAIQEELARLARQRSTLVIAHRLSTVIDADEILVLEHGRIVERGRHEALLAQGGLYAQMWSLQQQEQELEQAERRASLQPVNLAAVIAAVIDGLRPYAEARQITVYTSIASEVGRVTGDPGELQQLLWDLFANAIRVSPEGGRVEVQLSGGGGSAQVLMSDTGLSPRSEPWPPGDEMSASALSAQRPLDSEALRVRVEENEGVLEVRREEGVGSRYLLSFPLRAVAHGPPRPARTLPPIEGRRVLIVDDEADARHMLARVLTRRGARVEGLPSSFAAMDYLEAKPNAEWPDVLICDIALPDEDGYALLRRIRALEAERALPLTSRLPAIAFTGVASNDDRIRALLAGFQIHLAKPVDPDELVAAVAAVIGREPQRSAQQPAERRL